MFAKLAAFTQDCQIFSVGADLPEIIRDATAIHILTRHVIKSAQPYFDLAINVEVAGSASPLSQSLCQKVLGSSSTAFAAG